MKPKIIIVHECLGRLAGAETNIFVTVSNLTQFDFSLIYWKGTGNEEETLRDYFKSTCQLDFLEKKEFLKEKVVTFLKNEAPSLIYIHKCLSISIYELLFESGIPIVHMVHDHEVYCLRGSKYYPISQKICTRKAGLCCLCPGFAFIKRNEKGSLEFKEINYCEHKKLTHLDQCCDAFFAVTQYMKETLIKQGYDKSRIFIFPPIPPQENNPILCNFSDKNILIFAGQLIRGKGLDHLIKALSLVKTAFHLYVLGDGVEKKPYMKMVKELNLENKIHFVGFVPYKKMEEYYKEATMGVVPSVWAEPIATIGLEFMRHGMPVVGFDSGGIRDWLKNEVNGFLVPHLDIVTLAEKIEYLLLNKDVAKKFGQMAKVFIDVNYNFDEYIQNLTKKFYEIIEKK